MDSASRPIEMYRSVCGWLQAGSAFGPSFQKDFRPVKPNKTEQSAGSIQSDRQPCSATVRGISWNCHCDAGNRRRRPRKQAHRVSHHGHQLRGAKNGHPGLDIGVAPRCALPEHAVPHRLWQKAVHAPVSSKLPSWVQVDATGADRLKSLFLRTGGCEHTPLLGCTLLLQGEGRWRSRRYAVFAGCFLARGFDSARAFWRVGW